MKKRLTAVIVDDERLARNEMRSLLSQHNEIEVTGEAADIDTAISMIHAQRPDVVFLDIKLRKESAFELLDRLQTNPKIIFITAYDEFAIRAFEVNALDYLLKPVNPIRLEETVQRIVARESTRLETQNLEYDDRLFLKTDNHSQFVKVGDICLIRAAGDYSELFFTNGKSTLVLKPLIQWEQRLPPKYFVRIHRSAIINLEYVQKTEDWFHKSYRVHLKGIPQPLLMSRRHAVRLKRGLS